MSDFKTPGVYIVEGNAFPSSIVGAPTAVPAFIGYTEKADVDGKSGVNRAVSLSSMAEFERIFGRDFKPVYAIVVALSSQSGEAAESDSFQVGGASYRLQQQSPSQFNLYRSMQLFFNNGGDNCFVVSVGDYTAAGGAPLGDTVSVASLLKGLEALRAQAGVTMLVIPDAVLLPDGASFATVAQEMLAQCGELQDRVAILDVFGADSLAQTCTDHDLDAVISAFQDSLGSANLKYGVAYFPPLNAAIVQASDVNYTWFSAPQASAATSPVNSVSLQQLLKQEAANVLPPGTQRDAVEGYIDQMASVPDDGTPEGLQKVIALNQALSSALPAYQQWQNVIVKKRNVLHPSACMAGVFAANDQSRGVWNAPANIRLRSVVSCTLEVNDARQETLNAPTNGKAVNAIRDFKGRGTLVWGARTLDANSSDWRYVTVRRIALYLEQSIKSGMAWVVFEPNTATTWVTVVSMISNFLQSVWSQGGLVGEKPSDAFSVSCGLGSTMTSDDILNGNLNVTVLFAPTRPAEFIVLVFTQQMQAC